MRALAELIMRGRWVALVITFLGLPIISPAVVALVAMRKGSLEGALMLAALMSPVLFWLLTDVAWWGFLLTTLLSSALIYAAALMLRTYRSWPLTLVLISLVSTFGAYLIVWNIDLHADMMHMADYMKMGEIEKVDFEKAVAKILEQHIAAPIIALSVSLGVICSLLFARWVQALLYNPGGFREEFHGLRMDARLVGLTVVLAGGLMLVSNARGGILIVTLPLFFTGLGCIHWWAGEKRFSWLTWGVYLSLFLSVWVWITVITVGMLDSLFNLRKRIQQ